MGGRFPLYTDADIYGPLVDGLIERGWDVEKRIDADKAEATAMGVTGTPGFFVNGRYLSGAKRTRSPLRRSTPSRRS